MANLATGVFRDGAGLVVLVVQNTVPPTDEEWERYVAVIRENIEEPNGTALAFTDGGMPNAYQRGRVNETLAGRRAKSAVVSDSFALRSVITALSWFNPDTAAFAPNRIDEALRFAQVDGPRVDRLWRAVLALNGKLAVPSRVVAEVSASRRS